MKRALKEHAGQVAAVLGLFLVAGIATAVILDKQRLTLPWEDRYTVEADLASAQAATPGQGQTVTVSGVPVGEISKVSLVEGVARVAMELDPGKMPEDRIHSDARLTVRPRTPLQDLTLELDPGSPASPELDGEPISVANTTPQVNVDQVLASLDADTRAYMGVLLNQGGAALEGRGLDLRALFEASGPTLRRTKQVTASIAARRAQLQRLVGSLASVSGSLAGHGPEIETLVSQANATFGALAEQEGALRESFRRLPGTLESADAALTALRPFAGELGPTLEGLTPTVRRVPATLKRVRPLLRKGTPNLADVRRFTEKASPLVSDLRPAVQDLNAQAPALSDTFDAARYATNELAYVPEKPFNGYVFWLSWFGHNVNSMLSVNDAHGSYWRATAITSCSNVPVLQNLVPAIGSVLGASGICPP